MMTEVQSQNPVTEDAFKPVPKRNRLLKLFDMLAGLFSTLILMPIYAMFRLIFNFVMGLVIKVGAFLLFFILAGALLKGSLLLFGS